MLTEAPFGEGNEPVHLDGYNFMPYFRGDVDEGPRREFFYFSDGGDLVNLRYNRWKLVFAEQRAEGFEVWEEPFVPHRVPKLIDVYSDPFERAQKRHTRPTAIQPGALNGFTFWTRAGICGPIPADLPGLPPRQKPASFSIDQVLSSLQRNQGG